MSRCKCGRNNDHVALSIRHKSDRERALPPNSSENVDSFQRVKRGGLPFMEGALVNLDAAAKPTEQSRKPIRTVIE